MRASPPVSTRATPPTQATAHRICNLVTDSWLMNTSARMQITGTTASTVPVTAEEV